MEEESKPLGSLPLCFNSFQILKGNLHPEDLLAAIQETHAQVNSHINQEKLVEDKIKSEMEEKSKPLGSLPLYCNSFQILKGNLHPEDLLVAIHETHA